MGNRYGRKQKRAHRAALASKTELAARLDAGLFAAQKMVMEKQATIRQRDEALRLLGSDYGRNALDRAVAQAAGEFMKQAMQEIGRTGMAMMRVSVEKRPLRSDGRDVEVIRVLIPRAEYHVAVDEESTRER